MEFTIQVVQALAVLVIGYYGSQFLKRVLKSVLLKSKTDETVAKFLVDISYTALLTLVFIIALGTLGVETTSFIAVLGAATLAIGIALKDNLSNLSSGVILLLLRPFKIGDYIEAAGTAGTVKKISIFSTELKTPDNVTIIVPNAGLVGGNIKNFSQEETRRIDLVIGVSYDDNLKEVRAELESIIKENEKILTEKEVTIAVSELADSSVNFVVRPWVKREDYWAVKFDLLETIKMRFDEKDITIPYPQLDVNTKQSA